MPEDFGAPLFAAQTPAQAQSTSMPSGAPVDQPQRERAIDVTSSFIVQAPAGSGKTDLLTRRFLALLADEPIDSPDQILAITFTRAATAEMRNRILADLHKAAATPACTEDDERIQLARRALTRAQKAGWHLIEQPNLLQIETIDSLCLRIVQGQPLTARLGGRIDPTENAQQLYLEAARRTIRNLGGDNQELNTAIKHLLALRDNHLANCEGLIADMLEHRDQWEDAFPLTSNTDWDNARSILESPFREAISRTISQALELLDAQPLVAKQLLDIANYAGSNQPKGSIGLLYPMQSLPTPMSFEHWEALTCLLLTKEGDWRKRFTVNEGFPPASKGTEAKKWIAGRDEMMGRLRSITGLLESLRAIRTLPASRYDDDQWLTLRHLFTVLRQALAELRVLFAERNQIDFLYSSGAALDVLRNDVSGFAWADNIRHLLIDEFQDTSRRQHQLISTLVSHWSGDQSRTVFAVGDPMQSIYLFRQAEVELFHSAQNDGIRHGNDPAFHLEQLTLQTNFRSHARLTDPLNDVFKPVFEANVSPHVSPVKFNPSTAAIATIETIHKPAFQVHPQLLDARDKELADKHKSDLRHREAERVADIIQKHSDRIEQAKQQDAEYRVAILVRNRNHLAAIVPELRRREFDFRAVDLEPLAERQELLDLLSLVRALMLPMDRIAWLSVLRAPWCGLTLADLHALTGSDDPAARHAPMLQLIEKNLSKLGPDARKRTERTVDVLRRALEASPRQSQADSFAAWIERTWHALGGHLCLDATEIENTEVFFSLLDSVSPSGIEILNGEFQQKLDRLFAQPDPSVSETCGVQIMTIHKAKGLGFDVVIVPALERTTGTDDPPLITSLQRTNPQTGSAEFLIAPIGEKGGEKHRIYDWIEQQRKHRFAEERKRLFYVACTRARQELHLIGTASFNDKGVVKPRTGSLLHTAWPALESKFSEAIGQWQTSAEIISFPAPIQPGDVAQIAAQAEPVPALRRLRLDINIAPPAPNVAIAEAANNASDSQNREFHRPEGSRLARVIGSTLHLLLQLLGPQIAAGLIDETLLQQQITSLLRGSALDARQSQTALHELRQMIAACQSDPIARWILADHPNSQSEVSWTGWLDGSMRTLRADRIFHAGPEPVSDAEPECLWIIDYKTSDTRDDNVEEFLARERQIYSPQLAAYARAARAAAEANANLPVRLGLYYPRLRETMRFDWWEG